MGTSILSKKQWLSESGKAIALRADIEEEAKGADLSNDAAEPLAHL